jgi:GntR family transcriptional regulator/MocR family aminotransferase
MLMRIDPRRRVPLQQQIYESVRQAILSGELKPGSRLPSSRTLAQDLTIARMTAVLAFEQLAAEGYITSRVGAGTYVNHALPHVHAHASVSTRFNGARHPRLSRRGIALSRAPLIARKIGGPPRAFRLGVPALDRFPIKLWNKLVNRRMRQSNAEQLDYGDPAGLPALREAIALHVSRTRGTVCSAEQVIVVAGAQQGLEMITRLMLDPGDVACMEEPGYPAARAALISAGARIEPVPVDDQGVIVEHLSQHERARLIYTTPSHQFPLGVQMSLPRRLALLAWANAARAWIVEDDYDSEFRYSMRAVPSLHGLDADGRVIYVGSFSKTLFPALRLGYVIVPADLHMPMLHARRALDIHPPVPLQGAIADLMLQGQFERHVRRMNTQYRERLEALHEAVRRYCAGALTLRPVATGLHVVADLHTAQAETVSRIALERGIEAMPLSMYYSGRRASPANALVLGFGCVPPRTVIESAKRLASIIEDA